MGFETLVRDLYGKYAPDVDVEEKISAISKSDYSVVSFMDDFYAKYAPGKLDVQKKDTIIKSYFADEIKENEDKELKAKGQYREEDLKTGELAKLQAVDMVKGFGASVLQIADNFVVETSVSGRQALGRFAKQVDIFMDSGELRRLTGDEKKEAHFWSNVIAGATPGVAGISTDQFQDSSQDFIEKVGLDKVVYDQTLSESIRDSESNTVGEMVDNFVRLGGRAVSSGVESLPHTMAAMNPYGQVVLAVGAASSKLNEEMEKNPEINSELLLLNAVGHGGIELADAIITKRLLGGAGVMWGKGATESAVKSYFQGGAMRILGYTGAVAGEGLTEMAQSAANELWDGFVLGQLGGDEENRTKIAFGTDEFKNYWRKKQWEIYDEGIIGSLTGGGFTAINAAKNSDVKRYSRMVSMLAPLSVRQEHNGNLERFSELKEKLDKTTDPNSKKIIEDAMNVLRNKLQVSSTQAQQVVENLNESQLIDYAKNVDKVNKNLNKIDNNTTKDAKVIINEQNKELLDANNKVFNEVKEANFGENIKFAKKEGGKLGLDVNVLNTKNEFDNKVKALTKQDIKNESGVEGVFIGGGQILINKQTALNQGAISVGSHEVLHPVLNALVGNESKQKKIVDQFKKELTSKQRKYMDNAMKNKSAKEQSSEYLTVFSDGLRLKRMDYSLTNAESFMKLGKSILNAFKDVGFTNASFKDGKGVYEFMKEYNKSISEGKLTDSASRAIKNAEAKAKVKIKDVKALNKKGQFSQTSKQAQEVNDIYDKTANKTEAGFNIALKYRGMAENTFKSIRDGNSYTQDQIDKLNQNKDDIISMMLYDKIPSQKQDSKARNVLGLVNDFVKEKQKYGNVAAYINTFFKNRSKEVINYFVPDAVVESMNDSEGNMKTSVAKKSNTESNTDQGPAARALTDFNDMTINDEKFVTSDMYKKIEGIIVNNVSLLLSKNNLNVSSMTEVIEKEITNMVKTAQGKISKTEGKLVISKEYNNFVKNGYEAGIKSLPLRVIKDSYLNKLFPTKKLGKVDMQNKKKDNAALKKDSNYRLVKLQIQKPGENNWVKYFTEGGYTTLLAKQKKYAQEISKAISLKVTKELLSNDQAISAITEKSKLRNDKITPIVVEAYINSLEAKLDTKANEAVMFDEVQFSRKNAEQLVNDILAMTAEERQVFKDTKGNGLFKSDETFNIFKEHVFDNLIDPGVSKENIAYLGEATNLILKKQPEMISRVGSIRSKGVENPTIRDFMVKNLKIAATNINKKVFETIGIHLLGVHYRGINWSADKQKTFIKDLKDNVVEDKKGQMLLDKIVFEDVAMMVSGTDFYNDLVIEPMTFKTAAEGRTYLSDKRQEILNTITANVALAEYLEYKINNTPNLDGAYIFEMAQLQTNIVSGWRALSAPSHFFLMDGKQLHLNSNGKIKARPSKTLPKNPNNLPKNAKVVSVSKSGVINIQNPNYKKELEAYYAGWKSTVLYDIAAKFINKERVQKGEKPLAGNALKDRVIQDLMPKNEHLGANSLTMAKLAATAITKTLGDVSNTFADHITMWAPKVICDMIDAAGSKVNRSGENRVMLLPKELRGFVYNAKEGSSSQDVIKNETINELYKNYPNFQMSRNNKDFRVSFDKANWTNPDGTWLTSKEMLDKANQQARDLQYSKKNNSEMFNDIIEDTKGTESYKIYSTAGAKAKGFKIGRFEFFLPPSAEDFTGLLYKFLGKGKVGEAHMEFFKDKLLRPFASAMAEIDKRKQLIADDYKVLKKKMPNVKKILGEKAYKEYTYDSAIRVYLWTLDGKSIPGLSKGDQKALVDLVREDAALKSYAHSLSNLTRLNDSWTNPSEHWLGGNIPSDLDDVTRKVNRKELLQTWIKNKNEIFSNQNLNKIEALYGSQFRESLENILARMESGSNRSVGPQNRLVNSFMDWVNNSVGAIMFFNARSAVLQTISAVNFINFGDNNIVAAATAFANQKQFWADFSMLFNSDFLKQRRSGLKTDINEAELANAVGNSDNKVKAAFNYMLKKGFLPTQFADSFAIAIGGSSFIRNRINALIKKGMTRQEAMDQAMLDFREIAEESQQSSRPDRISSQQAGPLGRVILAFANTPMQYNRMIKKAVLDLKNGRGDWKTNVSKILYYGAAQNFIFNALQNALFALAFDDDDEIDKDEKALNIGNGMADSLLRGSGVVGAGVSTVKNMILEIIKQNKKDRPDYVNVAIQSSTLSPPISSKLKKLVSAARTFQWNMDEIKEEGLSADNPANLAVGKIVSAFTNVPLDRLVKKIDNLKTATDEETEAWQSIALALGWDQWSLGMNPYQKKNKKGTKLKKGQVKLRGKSVKLKSKTVKLRN